jgi:hypothetical protein
MFDGVIVFIKVIFITRNIVTFFTLVNFAIFLRFLRLPLLPKYCQENNFVFFPKKNKKITVTK